MMQIQYFGEPRMDDVTLFCFSCSAVLLGGAVSSSSYSGRFTAVRPF